MNRIDRLFAILLAFQTKSRIKAHELAAQFDISKRTVYRDISALNEVGVPIITLPGEGYELMPGYFLPPLLFTLEEASAVFLGARMLTQQTTGRLTQDAETALSKIETVLPKHTRTKIINLSHIINFYADQKGFDLDDQRLTLLQEGIQKQRVIWIRYFGYYLDDWTEREVEPQGLTYAEGRWYLQGYCRLRQSPRSFRLDRIDKIELRTETFVSTSHAKEAADKQIITIRFEPEIARWVSERQHYAVISEEPDNTGLICSYAVRSFREIMPWLLSWGAGIASIDPPALKQAVLNEFDKLKKKLT